MAQIMQGGGIIYNCLSAQFGIIPITEFDLFMDARDMDSHEFTQKQLTEDQKKYIDEIWAVRHSLEGNGVPCKEIPFAKWQKKLNIKRLKELNL